MTMDPAETLRIWQPVIDLARKLTADVVDDPEEILDDIATAACDAEAEEARRAKAAEW